MSKIQTDKELVSSLRDRFPHNPEKVFELLIKEYNIDAEDMASVIDKVDYENYIDSKELLLEKIRAAFESYKKNKITNTTRWGIHSQLPDPDRVFEILLDYYYDEEQLFSDVDSGVLFNLAKNGYEFDEYLEEQKQESYEDGYSDAEEFYREEHTNKELLKHTNNINQDNILDMYPEDLWKLLCNILHVGSYYDSNALMMKIDDVINKLKTSIYYKNK